MTGKVVNLNKARKTRARADSKVQAAENRVRFGRSKQDKTLAERRAGLDAVLLDDLKLNPDPKASF